MLLHVDLPELRIKIWTEDALKDLPKLVLIADSFSVRDVAYNAVRAVQAGLPWVHRRDHSMSRDQFWEVGRIVVGRLRRANEDVLISINGYPEFAAEWYCGVHVGAAGPSLPDARKVDGINGPIGFSAHSLEEARKAFDDGADYVFYSPIFPTPSKPGHPGLGIDDLRVVSSALVPERVYALGGVRPERVRRCMSAGAAGVAVSSAVIAADDPKAAAQALLYELQVG
jgi:thiamine-phosphate pyrophosphorylase